MTTGLVSIQVNLAPMASLATKVQELGRSLYDLRPLFEQLAADFYKDEKRIFMLGGPGQYADLAPSTKRQKQRTRGFVYPILFASGRLAASLLSRTAQGAVCDIGPRTFIIGTQVVSKDSRKFTQKNRRYKPFRPAPYPLFLHRGTRRMPARPLWLVGKDDRLMLRWNRIVDAYMEKAAKGAFG